MNLPRRRCQGPSHRMSRAGACPCTRSSHEGGVTMSQLVALSVSIGLLGGIATFLYLKLGLLIWAGFIAWACFFHSGGDTNALKNTIVGNAFGAVIAWIAALIILSFPMADSIGLPAWA